MTCQCTVSLSDFCLTALLLFLRPFLCPRLSLGTRPPGPSGPLFPTSRFALFSLLLLCLLLLSPVRGTTLHRPPTPPVLCRSRLPALLSATRRSRRLLRPAFSLVSLSQVSFPGLFIPSPRVPVPQCLWRVRTSAPTYDYPHWVSPRYGPLWPLPSTDVFGSRLTSRPPSRSSPTSSRLDRNEAWVVRDEVSFGGTVCRRIHCLDV